MNDLVDNRNNYWRGNCSLVAVQHPRLDFLGVFRPFRGNPAAEWARTCATQKADPAAEVEQHRLCSEQDRKKGDSRDKDGNNNHRGRTGSDCTRSDSEAGEQQPSVRAMNCWRAEPESSLDGINACQPAEEYTRHDENQSFECRISHVSHLPRLTYSIR
jgi:hypothetical protein